MDFGQIAPTLKTGDLVLFHGTTTISSVIDWLTDSAYSHVGMIVRQGEQPGNDKLHIWQSFEPQHGVVSDSLESFLQLYVASETGATFAVRHLSAELSATQLGALSQFMEQVKGRPFPAMLPWMLDYIAGRMGIATNETTFYCSELVAQSFMEMGLLPPRPLATTYTPGSFSAADASLPLQQGFSFGPEIQVTLDPAPVAASVANVVAARALVDPVPPSAYPTFRPITTPAPAMPVAWSATVLLHPFSPPAKADPTPDNPFFQMGVAAVEYVKDEFFSARVAGCESNWWYVTTKTDTRLSTDRGATWQTIDIGWSLPSDWYGAQAPNARCAGASPLNWMSARPRDWWVIPVPQPGDSPPYATWMSFDSATGDPVRMMFGDGPPRPTMGDPTQLAFFQMFSLTCFSSFTRYDAAHAPALPTVWTDPVIPGLSVGNPRGYKPFIWNTNSALTAFSTPVNGNFNPLPSRTLYVWKPDPHYVTYTDRAQSTLMHYTYNQARTGSGKAIATVESLLTGHIPAGAPPQPHAGAGFLYTRYDDGSETCDTGASFDFGQEPPNWVSIPQAQGTCEATIVDNPALSPNTVVTIYSVLFPPAAKYPQGTYLWAWYAPLSADGVSSRPVLFMQAQSALSAGTSLALDDYFFYDTPWQPIDPANFEIPSVCLTNPKIGGS
jgi:hypothetical protein